MCNHSYKTYRRLNVSKDKIMEITKCNAICKDVIMRKFFLKCVFCNEKKVSITDFWKVNSEIWYKNPQALDKFKKNNYEYHPKWVKNPYWEIEHQDIVDKRINERLILAGWGVTK